MLKNKSYFKKSTGDEAGCAAKKGVVTSVNKGKVYFVAWSMDVKFEGENVVRHLDMTTHNHPSSTTNTGPWPYADAMAMAVKGHPCKKMADDIKGKCSGASDYSADCCNARKCFLMPKEPNRCCNGPSGVQMTGHHLLPSKEFVAWADRGAKDAASGYVSDNAPCLCVEGSSHSRNTEHGQIGCSYTVVKNNWVSANSGKKYTLNVGCSNGAKSAVGKVSVPAGSQGCDEPCLERQLTDGHANMNLNRFDRSLYHVPSIRFVNGGRHERRTISAKS